MPKEQLQTKAQDYDVLEQQGIISREKTEIPACVTKNLAFPLRPYQVKAVHRFRYFCEQDKDREGKHALFAMATGAGKTLIMASNILYLYEQGYRLFVFFVNSTAVLEKTKENFCNKASAKYLFQKEIRIRSSRIEVHSIQNLAEIQEHAINILFTTIQGLESHLNNPKENALSYEDFAHSSHKCVFLADEAHHLNTQTKSDKELFNSWESTVLKLVKQQKDNFLLEYTATPELNKASIAEKYQKKILISYTLREFYQDKYSKTINLAESRTGDLQTRYILALLSNLYRGDIAADLGISLKPVMLFKCKDIKQCDEYYGNFMALIEHIRDEQIQVVLDQLEDFPNAPLFRDIAGYYKNKNRKNLASDVRARIARYFREEYCLVIHSKKENENKRTQILVNSLEDPRNRIRVIFAVDKLNEGWDVLNLYDIIKLFNTAIPKSGKPATTQQAQLLGRGARYNPLQFSKDIEYYTKPGSVAEKVVIYATEDLDSVYKRKFDKHPDFYGRALEQLHFHTEDDATYIRSLVEELEKDGIGPETYIHIERRIKLKPEFIESPAYRESVLFLNKKLRREVEKQRNLFFGEEIYADENKAEYRVYIAIGADITEEEITDHKLSEKNSSDSRHTEQTRYLFQFPQSVIRKALAQVPFFYLEVFNRHSGLRPSTGISDLIKRFGGIESTHRVARVIFVSRKNVMVEALLQDREVQRKALVQLFEHIAKEIQNKRIEFRGSEYVAVKLSEVIKQSRVVTIGKDTLLQSGKDYPYYAQDLFYDLNPYEKSLVEYVQNIANEYQIPSSKLWILRNIDLRIYNKADGQGFQPDFILIMEHPEKGVHKDISDFYAAYMEPKGPHLAEKDAWKAQLLKQLSCEESVRAMEKKTKYWAFPFFMPDGPKVNDKRQDFFYEFDCDFREKIESIYPRVNIF